MHISTFKITDYKSFLETQVISLQSGINIVVGPNNAGKTALLEAVSLRGTNNVSRYRSRRMVPDEEGAVSV
jgi:AAA15 family ATPase/GTPase